MVHDERYDTFGTICVKHCVRDNEYLREDTARMTPTCFTTPGFSTLSFPFTTCFAEFGKMHELHVFFDVSFCFRSYSATAAQ